MAWTLDFKKNNIMEKRDFLFNYLKNRPENPLLQKGYISVLKYIIASLMIEEEYKNLSLDAYNSKKILKYINDPGSTYRNEHTIPVSLVTDYILNSIPDNILKNDDLLKEHLSKLISSTFGVCLITVSEDNRLNEKGLKKSLPNNIKIADIIENPKLFYCRYEAIGIKLIKKY